MNPKCRMSLVHVILLRIKGPEVVEIKLEPCTAASLIIAHVELWDVKPLLSQ